MKYDPKTEILTLPSGQEVHRVVVEQVVDDVLQGTAVLVAPCEDEGKLWYIARTATDEDGRGIVAKRRVGEDRLLKRLERVFRAWGARQPPTQRREDCTYPNCACRPPVGGGPTVCAPRVNYAEMMGLAPAEEIAPKCETCGKSIRVGEGEAQSGAMVFRAVCSDPFCDWNGIVVVTTKTLPPVHHPEIEG